MRFLPTTLRRALAEPVIQFLLLGAVVYVLVGRDAPADEVPIVVSATEQDMLGRQFERNRRRAPSAAERQALIDTRVDEAVLVREARRLGLDQGDEIIRRRLLQKMGFVLEARAQPDVPAPEQLLDYFRDHAEHYAQPARYTLEHIFFRQGRAARDRAEALLTQMPAVPEPASAGEHFDHGYRFVGRSFEQLRDTFGPGFAESIAGRTAATGWFGPVRSLYGEHLVRVLEVRPAHVPAYERVADRVYADWRQAEQQRLITEQTRKLRERYRVRIEPADALP